MTTNPLPADTDLMGLADGLSTLITAWFHGKEGAEATLAYFVANNRAAILAALRSAEP